MLEENPATTIDSRPPPGPTPAGRPASHENLESPENSPPTPTCRLEVYMEILPAKWSEFENYGIKLVQLFKQEHLVLKQSMYESPSAGNGDRYVVYNYWDLDGDLNNVKNASLA